MPRKGNLQEYDPSVFPGTSVGYPDPERAPQTGADDPERRADLSDRSQALLPVRGQMPVRNRQVPCGRACAERIEAGTFRSLPFCREICEIISILETSGSRRRFFSGPEQ